MFRTVPLSIIRRFHCTHSNGVCHTGYSYSLRAGSGRFCPDPARKLSAILYDIFQCCVYSKNLLMTGRGTVRNMYSFISK